MQAVLSILRERSDVSAVSFTQRAFWGRPEYVVDCWQLRRGARNYNRLFKWGPGYRYVTHEPPTVVDASGRNLRRLNWIRAEEMAKRGVFLFHYSLLFPWQVEQKVRIYRDEKPDLCGEIVDWAEQSYFKLKRPYRVHNLYRSPSWLDRFSGVHPPQVIEMMDDVLAGRTPATVRGTEDVERLLGRWWYPVGRVGLMAGDHVDRFFQSARHSRASHAARQAVRRMLPKRHL